MRDAWGNPYIISLDLNFDGKCRDVFYRQDTVSRTTGTIGHNGLVAAAGPNSFELNQPMMIWSLGPDGRADPGAKANAGFNSDNILSW